MPPERRVLVSGASGFVGAAACRVLNEAGWRVRGMVRGARPLAPGVEPAPVRGLDDRPGLARAVAGCHAVVHLAARVHVMRDRSRDPLADFRQVNVEGSLALFEAAAAAGVGRFVFASSVKAMGEATQGTPWTEATPARPLDPYGISKLEAERALLARAGQAGLPVTVLRFPLVYGPGVRANLLRLLQRVEGGGALPLGGVHNRRSLLFVGNAAAAMAAVLEAPAAAGETLLVADAETVSTAELARRIGTAMGRPARLWWVPQRLLRAAGRAGDLLARRVPFPLTSAALDRLLGSLEVDASRLARVTGRALPYTLDEGIAETVAWYLAAAAANRDGRPAPPEGA
jgi:nucleoside-diphosphate-sugar epimerase